MMFFNTAEFALTFVETSRHYMYSLAKHLVLLIGISFYSIHLSGQSNIASSAAKVLKPFVDKELAWAMTAEPITVTASSSTRSSGGKHDFFSEGDYWWPNPASADSPYVQRDGMTNPDNFTDHRKAMIRFSRIMGTLASGYIISKNEQYASRAFQHARAWFIDTATLMNPHLLYAQAIKGRFTGRGIGIIDMIQMMEVSQALIVLEKSKSAKPVEYVQFRVWFEKYLNWVTHHKYGIDEMNALNNHGTCWTMQVAGICKVHQKRFIVESLQTTLYNIAFAWTDGPEWELPQGAGKNKAIWVFPVQPGCDGHALSTIIRQAKQYVGI